MKTIKVDKATLKATIKELLLEDGSILKDVVKEVFEELSRQKLENQSEEVEKQIDAIFDEYDTVLKRLFR